MTPITFDIPLRTVSESNARGHWSLKAKRARHVRSAVALVLRGPIMKAKPKPPLVVNLTRIAPRALDDDNLRGCLKAERDAVAALLGVKDNHPGVLWTYGQEKRGVGEYAVRITIEKAGGEDGY